MRSETGDGRAGALDGISGLDFSHALAGPFCSLVLAAFGACVLKLESPAARRRNSRNKLVMKMNTVSSIGTAPAPPGTNLR